MVAKITFFPVGNGDMTLIELESGRWFYDEVTCRQADATSAPPAGCVTALAGQ